MTHCEDGLWVVQYLKFGTQTEMFALPLVVEREVSLWIVTGRGASELVYGFIGVGLNGKWSLWARVRPYTAW